MSHELTIIDQPSPCPYLPDRTARMPLRYCGPVLDQAAWDAFLAEGDRRCGSFLYRTLCPQCRSCEAIRIDVGRFRPDATMRRVLRRGDRQWQTRIGPPQCDPQRVALFNLHRNQRDLATPEGDLDTLEYEAFLVDSIVPSLEFSYWSRSRLVAVAIADPGADSLSAMYCYFDPAFASGSPGTYSILKQVEYCRVQSMRYLYLGYYIAESRHMSYKARFRPHERLVQGRWQRFD